jgi:LPXTG-motif cell wall-anchored protein
VCPDAEDCPADNDRDNLPQTGATVVGTAIFGALAIGLGVMKSLKKKND